MLCEQPLDLVVELCAPFAVARFAGGLGIGLAGSVGGDVRVLVQVYQKPADVDTTTQKSKIEFRLDSRSEMKIVSRVDNSSKDGTHHELEQTNKSAHE